MFYPDITEYVQMSSWYNLIPVYTELLVDMDTPISIFKKVCQGKYSYLLESVEGGENLARYSFIGCDPFVNYRCRSGTNIIEKSEGKSITRTKFPGSPLDILRMIMEEYKAPAIEGLPRFYGGAVGYFGYDLIRYIEDIPEGAVDDLCLPDCHFILTRLVLIFDHVKHKVKIVVNTEPGGSPEENYKKAIVSINAVKHMISTNSTAKPAQQYKRYRAIQDLESNMSEKDFMVKVEKAKEYIKSGDISQVVLSQRLKMHLQGTPFDIYRNLRTVNPAPYLFYLNFDETVIIGSSPEMLIRVEDGEILTCPIAGTRPRGKNSTEDELFELELRADEKEKAEHLMLVDLGRNDLGRVCSYGSIKLKSFMEIERYSHVMHLVSTVSGKLLPGMSGFDALKACFPAGTVTGAPKIRAMEIIEELEPTRRGVYAGVIGYIGFTGNIDTCITIRTIVVNKETAYIQAGAGIVADSVPEKEYEETINKAKALLETLMLKEVG